MNLSQSQWTASGGWTGDVSPESDLTLVFGARHVLGQPERIAEIRARNPKARLFGCSTAGEIAGTEVHDDSIVTTSLRFDHTRIRTAEIRLSECSDSRDAGVRLARDLNRPDLVHILVASDGLKVNGTEFVQGLRDGLPAAVSVTGGLSGDGPRFEKTLVVHGEIAAEGVVAGVGFYGTRLKVGYGSLGGWDPFGPDRLITRAKGNVLYELDGKPALDLYRKYLGEYANDLPASGLLFPLMLRRPDSTGGVVRTLLAINEQDKSVTFAGDMPEGDYARLMKANFERLIEGAMGAARAIGEKAGDPPDFAVLISCVGRKLLLKQRIEEEVEGVREVLGDRTVLTGFYSYGEICPFTPTSRCELHNQTMTITTFTER